VFTPLCATTQVALTVLVASGVLPVLFAVLRRGLCGVIIVLTAKTARTVRMEGNALVVCLATIVLDASAACRALI